ncbi:MAG: hypothetical protein E6R04_01575 [Spirochaetes bacterium]|nr:MAG: hypothetical protein E6R04_01575 [Spirochaetota bacterium]
MTANDEMKFLFIKHDFMLGDGDDYLPGTALVERSYWLDQCETFRKAVEENYDPSIFSETERKTGNYSVDIVYNDFDLKVGSRDYTVRECTSEEAVTLNKFLNPGREFKVREGVVFTDGRWRELTYWIDSFA